jgi:hypothetical protein
MVRRRARDAGIETAIGNHSFRAIGITDYLERGGDINIAKRMAGMFSRIVLILLLAAVAQARAATETQGALAPINHKVFA